MSLRIDFTATTPVVSTLMLAFCFGLAAVRGQGIREHRDIPYATVGSRTLTLDLYVPTEAINPPLLVWVHGGAWRSGDKSAVPQALITSLFAVASLDFRLTTEAPFPANIHDIKAAIRFLRANAAKYAYQADRIAIAGSSSGGHLAALVGVTNDHKALEGSEGDYVSVSSSVQAIVDYFGASDLTTILAQSTPHGLSVREPALKLLLGDLPDKVPDLARLASPVYHVDKGDPPLFVLHGDRDPQMPINQAHQLVGKYKENGLDVAFDVVYGAAHGGDPFYSGIYLTHVLDFLRHHLISAPAK